MDVIKFIVVILVHLGWFYRHMSIRRNILIIHAKSGVPLPIAPAMLTGATEIQDINTWSNAAVKSTESRARQKPDTAVPPDSGAAAPTAPPAVPDALNTKVESLEHRPPAQPVNQNVTFRTAPGVKMKQVPGNTKTRVIINKISAPIGRWFFNVFFISV